MGLTATKTTLTTGDQAETEMTTLVKRFTNNRGFTLLELLIVITILGCLFGIVIPRFRGALESARLESVAETIAGAAMLARSEAIAAGEVRILYWDNATAAVGIQAPAVISKRGAGRIGDGYSEGNNERTISREFHVHWSSKAVQFYPNGTAEGAWIELENIQRSKIRIEIGKHRTTIGKIKRP